MLKNEPNSMETVVDFQEKVQEKATKNEVDNFYLNLSIYRKSARKPTILIVG